MPRKLVSFLLSGILILSMPVPALASFATPSDAFMDGRLPVASGSDAHEVDSSFSVEPAPYSSLGTVTNTVDYDGVYLYADFYSSSGAYLGFSQSQVDSSGHGTIQTVDDAGYMAVGIYLDGSALPSSGTCSFTADFASDFSVNWQSSGAIGSIKDYSNAESDSTRASSIPVRQNSGDWQMSGTVEIGSSLRRLIFLVWTTETDSGFHFGDPFGGYIKVNFKRASDSTEPDYSTPGTGSASSTQDFQSGVTDIMGSISDTLVEIVATISDQLKALWDQMYNYMHLEQLANDDKNTGQIVDAINGQGSQVSQDIINNQDNNTQDIIDSQESNAQDIINNQNSNFDNLENGYDNSGIASDNEKLDDALDNYDALEDSVMEQVEDRINDFEFDNPFESFTAPHGGYWVFPDGDLQRPGRLKYPHRLLSHSYDCPFSYRLVPL